jgi:hypothetical protein
MCKPFASVGLACGERSVAEPIPQSFLAALTDLVGWLDQAHVPSMVIGGVAASVLGQPRLTQDVDALAIIPEAEWGTVMAAAAAHGIAPRLQDIEALLATHPDADTDFVRQWVREFATAMSMSDILEDFEKLLARHRSKPRSSN